jgi:hypothetical protein
VGNARQGKKGKKRDKEGKRENKKLKGKISAK